MIKNIVFDIGNVLTYYTWEKHIQKFGFDEATCKRVASATVQSKEWNEIDRGVLSDEEVEALLIKNDPGVEKEIHQMFSNLGGLVEHADYAIPWLLELKAKGYGVYYLSNFSSKCQRECGKALDFIPYMDGGILSYEENLIKPQPEIYQRLMEKYGLQADTCVFLDDLEANVKAAQKEGMYGIVFTTREAAQQQLKELGVV